MSDHKMGKGMTLNDKDLCIKYIFLQNLAFVNNKDLLCLCDKDWINKVEKMFNANKGRGMWYASVTMYCNHAVITVLFYIIFHDVFFMHHLFEMKQIKE